LGNTSSWLIKMSAVGFSYGERRILENINLTVYPGEIIAIVGRSGCGKTTLLRCIAGLRKADSGFRDAENGLRIAMLFQETLLQPWLTVAENVRLPAKIGKYDLNVMELLARVGLRESALTLPSKLSGGMRRRVALARALAQRPRLLLLDEPYSNLDEATAHRMYEDLLGLVLREGIGVVVVTHSLTEALRIASRVIILAGRPATIAADNELDKQVARLANVESVNRLRVHLRQILTDDIVDN
jgi:ABC-type nitrate/sulfonate/bicarbonate transport system ATPase subunit